MAKFQTGNPGGPGTPRGSKRPLLAGEFRNAVREDRLQQIVDEIATPAIGGDMTAAKIIVDRVYPIPDARVAELLERLEQLEETLALRSVA